MNSSSGAREGPIREIDIGSKGIDLQHEFDEEFAVSAAAKAHSELPATRISTCCYYEHDKHSVGSYFRRAGDPWGSTDAAGLFFPDHLSLDTLAEDPRWPVCAVGGGLQAEAFAAKWCAQMRIEQGWEFVGYLVIVGADEPAPDEAAIQRAFVATKGFVSDCIKQRRANNALLSLDFERRLLSAEHAILGALHDPDSRNLGLRFVADLLTSHLGAGWNRAACYCPVGPGRLRCLWAQGGDVSVDWSDRVQRPIGEGVRSVEQLVTFARDRKIPKGDDYYRAAVDGPGVCLNLDRNPDKQSIVASLWNKLGDVLALPSAAKEWEPTHVPATDVGFIDREQLSRGGAHAARFDHADPWVNRVRDERLGPVFASRNGLYWGLPWFLGDELIAIWIVDMAYWGTVPEDRVGIPSLVVSDQILRRLGPACDALRKDNWNGGRF